MQPPDPCIASAQSQESLSIRLGKNGHLGSVCARQEAPPRPLRLLEGYAAQRGRGLLLDPPLVLVRTCTRGGTRFLGALLCGQARHTAARLWLPTCPVPARPLARLNGRLQLTIARHVHNIGITEGCRLLQEASLCMVHLLLASRPDTCPACGLRRMCLTLGTYATARYGHESAGSHLHFPK